MTEPVDLDHCNHPVWVAVDEAVPLAVMVEATKSADPVYAMCKVVDRTVRAALAAVGYGATAEATPRVRAYLAEHDRRVAGGGNLHPETIHSFGLDNDAARLRASDLRALLKLVSPDGLAPSDATPRRDLEGGAR